MNADLSALQFIGLYELPGEGLVVEFRYESEILIYDRLGLQHRIVQRKNDGLDTSVEEDALGRINAIATNYNF